LRHIARRFREHGFVSIAIRLPAHGTVPGALTDVEWQDWMRRHGSRSERRDDGSAHYSFAYDRLLQRRRPRLEICTRRLEDPRLARPDRLVLISPMIGITQFARFAGLAGLPAVLPAFAKAAWLSVMPEFNPFKYNSFPVNGGGNPIF